MSIDYLHAQLCRDVLFRESLSGPHEKRLEQALARSLESGLTNPGTETTGSDEE